ncbi:hypothetical protein NHX12_026653 [Muraenolepis orangiensis]|uniref:Uncharacterized protein n=1 Tax=Muraenolepis orangiensis TaxID=630683 RepID=A0A9Q0EHU2_9TELE|nr:hypothetical protein NHX12_026653 [Muraenolepis orangiensis]
MTAACVHREDGRVTVFPRGRGRKNGQKQRPAKQTLQDRLPSGIVGDYTEGDYTEGDYTEGDYTEGDYTEGDYTEETIQRETIQRETIQRETWASLFVG